MPPFLLMLESKSIFLSPASALLRSGMHQGIARKTSKHHEIFVVGLFENHRWLGVGTFR